MACCIPWRGCHRYSEGWKYCYIHKGDFKRDIDTSKIYKTKDFTKIIDKDSKGNYKVQSGLVYTCFSTDFFIKEADSWRDDAINMMKERSDLQFLFLTKRIDRVPNMNIDFTQLNNVTIGCTVENQKSIDKKLPIFKELPILHKDIILQPLLESVNIEPYLEGIDLVVVGGESDYNARPLDFEWVKNIYQQCMKHNIRHINRCFKTITIFIFNIFIYRVFRA